MKIGLQTWGSEGDARPFANLAGALARAGHQVTLAITELAPRDYAETARRDGYTLRMVSTPVFRDPAEAREVGLAMVKKRHPVLQARLLISRAYDPVESAMAEVSRELCEGHDLVIGHYILHSLSAAAELTATPWVSVQLTPDFVPSHGRVPHGLPELGPWFRPLAWKLASTVCDHLLLGRVNQRRRAWGLRPHRQIFTDTWASPRLNLIASSPTLFPRPTDWAENHLVCGFFNAPDSAEVAELDPAMEAFLSSGTAPVYFGFGSLMFDDPEYVAAVREIWTDAVRETGCRAIFQLPDQDRVHAAPAILEIKRCSHAAVFPRCAAVVHHGGAGTTQAALRAGRPSVIVPHIADQFFWGSLLWRKGAASRPLSRTRLNARRLSRRIKEVLRSQSCGERVMALGSRMRTENGVEKAVEAIQKLS